MNKREDVDRALVADIAREWEKNTYYGRAESQDWVNPFWSEHSLFRQMFLELDCTCLLELASGQGRHIAQILANPQLPKPRQIIAMDVNSSNVRFCAKRFAQERNVRCIRNNGVDFRPLETNSVSGIFCYDAMVHFEYDCVVAYIKDAHRVLQLGGRALFHHSNYTSPGSMWTTNPHWRNFMSKEIFAHVAMRVGFSVVRQAVIDWGTGDSYVSNIDCITLLEKIVETPEPPKRNDFWSRLWG
jgi:ubiquinone/menaquinone biosynthesis C-methylase UbiE